MEDRKMLIHAVQRFYADYLLPGRMDAFRNIILRAKAAGYEHLTITEYIQAMHSNTLPPKVFIHRHDIDSDPLRAAQFFEIERSLQIRSTFYFRLKTKDCRLMPRIFLSGSEVGYHYEEIAAYAYKHRIYNPGLIMENMETIRNVFRINFRNFSSLLPKPVTTIASHGDFVNRILGIPNHVLVNEQIREEFELLAECYDPALTSSYGVILSDRPFPTFYHPDSPLKAIEQQIPVIYLLTHPRHWGASVGVNLEQDVERLFKGLIYRIRL